jgi:hypothetical protein
MLGVCRDLRFGSIYTAESCKNGTMGAFKLILVSLAGWMNSQQQHVIEYLQGVQNTEGAAGEWTAEVYG